MSVGDIRGSRTADSGTPISKLGRQKSGKARSGRTRYREVLCGGFLLLCLDRLEREKEEQ